VHVVATHLGLRPWERRQQVRHLLKLFEVRLTEIYVLMGDLNEWFLWGRPLRWLHAHFKRPPHCATFPAQRPFMALDRLWVHPRRRLKSLEAHTSGLARIASDHLPLKAIIEI
jgi:endonuclease/exonuclease/phosphatase family metal-dependent hydrolase